jgi:hypothetical protein
VVFEMAWHWETLGGMIKMSGYDFFFILFFFFSFFHLSFFVLGFFVFIARTQPQSMLDFFNLDWKDIVLYASPISTSCD